MIPKAREQKKIMSFIDKIAEKNRMKKAKHKGGMVPVRRRKVEVEYYPSSGEEEQLIDNDGEGEIGFDGRKTHIMYDLMVRSGQKLKAFSREEEERRKKLAQMTKYGISLDDMNGKIPLGPLEMPELEDLTFDTHDSTSGSEDLMEEFRGATVKD